LFARVLLMTWAVTAVWDALCASALAIIGYGSSFSALWSGVAATALLRPREPTAINAALGLLVHTGVTLVWSALVVAALFSSARLRSVVRRWSGVLGGAAIYGPLIWLAMSLGAIPAATGRDPSPGVRWWVQFVAHIPFVTVPMVMTARALLRPNVAGVRAGRTLPDS
jgi:hypothetical protein